MIEWKSKKRTSALTVSQYYRSKNVVFPVTRRVYNITYSYQGGNPRWKYHPRVWFVQPSTWFPLLSYLLSPVSQAPALSFVRAHATGRNMQDRIGNDKRDDIVGRGGRPCTRTKIMVRNILSCTDRSKEIVFDAPHPVAWLSSSKRMREPPCCGTASPPSARSSMSSSWRK